MPLTLPTIQIGTVNAETLTGTTGTDSLYGLDGDDSLSGGAGDDLLAAGAGTNRIDAGDGNDMILIDPNSANGSINGSFIPANGVDGGTGWDTMAFAGPSTNYHVVQIVGGTLQVTDLTTGAKTYTINVEHLQFDDVDVFLSPLPAGMAYGSPTADLLAGTTAAETIFGQGGDDTISGGSGNDSLTGGAGADQLAGDNGNDTIVSDAADVKLDGGRGTDWLVLGGSAGVNLGALDQTSGDAAVTRGFENVDASALATGITLTGSEKGNLLIGSQGDDIITGARGADELAGLGGADRFVYASTLDSAVGRADSIQGFTTGQDVIDLSGIDAIKGGRNDAFTFIDAAAFSAAGQLRYDAATGVLEGDVDGDGIADISIALTDLPALTAGDLIL